MVPTDRSSINDCNTSGWATVFSSGTNCVLNKCCFVLTESCSKFCSTSILIHARPPSSESFWMTDWRTPTSTPINRYAFWNIAASLPPGSTILLFRGMLYFQDRNSLSELDKLLDGGAEFLTVLDGFCPFAMCWNLQFLYLHVPLIANWRHTLFELVGQTWNGYGDARKRTLEVPC